MADDAGVSPERFARELLEVALIEQIERRHMAPLGEPAGVDNRAGRKRAAVPRVAAALAIAE